MNQVVELPPKMGAIASGGAVRAIVPQTLDDAYRLANMIVKAGMAPGAFKTAEAVVVALLHGLEVGLPPMMALQSIAVINNRPTLWGDGAMALVRATGQLEEFEEWIDGEGENMIAYCKVKRRNEKPVTHSFSVADAKKAGLWGKQGPWLTYPRRMIAMRPRSWCLRDVFADALKGLRIAEEVMDTDMKDVTPPPAPTVPSPPQAQIEQQQADEPEKVYGVPDAYEAGEIDYEGGHLLSEMPIHFKQFPELEEAYTAGWQSKVPGAGE
ncbi:MAG: hypothetical protein Q8L53_16900 [Aestuariivirga sp.]|nr:hypothetical protein [Aestuariivirga sp.]